MRKKQSYQLAINNKLECEVEFTKVNNIHIKVILVNIILYLWYIFM